MDLKHEERVATMADVKTLERELVSFPYIKSREMKPRVHFS